jgi:thiamine-phosphate diphosphorylase
MPTSLLGKAELYCITCAPRAGLTYETMVEQACAGGAQVIQFRFEGAVTNEIIDTARKLRDICRAHKTLFVINNYPELAKDVDADGVHLGQEDMSILQARNILGPGKLIGSSTQTFEQAIRAQLQHADYIGFGPIYATPTKPASPAVGIQCIAAVVSKMTIPVFVIGGITEDRVEQVIAAGANRVAVVRAVCGSDKVQAAAARMRILIENAIRERLFKEL